MRWSAYVILCMSLTLMLYIGGFKPLMGDNIFNGWLTNMVGPSPNSTSAAIPITYSNVTNGQTQSNNSSGLGMFSIFTGDLIQSIWGTATSNPLLAILAIVGTAAAIWLLMQGFSANYLIPILMLGVMIALNFFFFPLNFLTDPSIGMPTILKVLIAVILNTLFILAMMDFIRGGA